MIEIIDGNLFDSNAHIICHQCNCQGVMGSGVAAEVKKRYPHVFEAYHDDYKNGLLRLGYVNFACAKEGQIIANMCGQDKYGHRGKYTDYDKLRECMDTVAKYAADLGENTVIALPWLMSCHRGGGDWNIVYKMIEEAFKDYNVEIWRLNNG